MRGLAIRPLFALIAGVVASTAAAREAQEAAGVNRETEVLLGRLDPGSVAQAEEDARRYLDARAKARIGPVLLEIERFTAVKPDGSVVVSQYWGRAPLQAYLYFDAFDILGDRWYLDVALACADHYLKIQEPEGFWHYAHIVKPDGETVRLDNPDFQNRAVCRIQDTHQMGAFRLLLYAWGVTGDEKYLRGAKCCGDYMLSIQNENGSWPDYWIPGHRHTDPNPRQKAGVISGGSYNDGATSGGVEMMIIMFHLTRDPKYVARFPHLGRWIFDTQFGQGRVRGWCQQYDLANRPAAARHFESPVIDPRTFPRFIVPLCAWLAAMSGEDRYLKLLEETVEWVRSVEKPGPDGGWAYQYLPDGTPVFTLGGVVYRHDRPETWPKEFPEKHDGIQRYSRDNAGVGDAPKYLELYRRGGLRAIQDAFRGPVELTPLEFAKARLAAARRIADPAILASVRERGLREADPRYELDRGTNESRRAARLQWEFLRNVRIARGAFTAKQLAPGGSPPLCGDRPHSFKVGDWFSVPWSAPPRK